MNESAFLIAIMLLSTFVTIIYLIHMFLRFGLNTVLNICSQHLPSESLSSHGRVFMLKNMCNSN